MPLIEAQKLKSSILGSMIRTNHFPASPPFFEDVESSFKIPTTLLMLGILPSHGTPCAWTGFAGPGLNLFASPEEHIWYLLSDCLRVSCAHLVDEAISMLSFLIQMVLNRTSCNVQVRALESFTSFLGSKPTLMPLVLQKVMIGTSSSNRYFSAFSHTGGGSSGPSGYVPADD